MADLTSIQKKIIAFRNERDWAQFHDPSDTQEITGERSRYLWKICAAETPGGQLG